MNLLVFDMDGVLVDVSASYREATRQAAYIFLKGCKGGDLLKAPLFSLSELAAVKQSGGLNNDWDMTHRVISLLLVMAENAGGFTERTQWDVEPLARYLDSTERPLSAIMESGHLSKAADAYYAGDVGSGNVIKQIFQEIYLGQELFTRTYGFAPQYCKQEGLILKEKLFTPKELLKKLAESGTLAIATGRPRSEALYPLENMVLICSLQLYRLMNARPRRSGYWKRPAAVWRWESQIHLCWTTLPPCIQRQKNCIISEMWAMT